MQDEELYNLHSKRLRLFFDRDKSEAEQLAHELRNSVSDDPEMIVVIGGDGTMLRAIRQHWRDGLPFYGLNTGHLGFLLNDPNQPAFPARNLRRYRLPLLAVDVVGNVGIPRHEVAFNDCWIERETGQTAWVEVSVNNQVRMSRVVADGMLISTAAGSTSYARAMGASPLPLNANLLTLAASNVLKPEFWRPAVLPSDSVIRMKNLDPQKRPWRGFIDGIAQGEVLEMTARTSATASVELLFAPEFDPVAKLAVVQFPQVG
jgi:NAD kinase